MNSGELKDMVASYQFLKKYIEICAINTLPKNVFGRFPRIFIINTDPLPNPGKHWVCVLFLNSSSAEYFDSLGDPAHFYDKHLQKFIKENSNECDYSFLQLQSNDSSICGLYVILFILMRIGFQMTVQNVYAMFDQDLKQNDKFVSMCISKILFNQ